MASHRPKVPNFVKKKLIFEAGDKCANPGCANRLIEIHHIKEWHIYKSHNEPDMIAICPTCHDAITRGNLRIDDQTLYNWKNIHHQNSPAGHIYVEPSQDSPKIILGTLSVQSETGFVVFDLNEYNDLEFCVRDEIILLPRLRIGSSDEPLIEVVDGHVLKKSEKIKFDSRPGKVQVRESNIANRLPEWAKTIIDNDSSIDMSNELLLDIEVKRPGLIKIKGIWISDQMVVIVNEKQISFIYPKMERPLSVVGAGETETVLHVTSPSVLFALTQNYIV